MPPALALSTTPAAASPSLSPDQALGAWNANPLVVVVLLALVAGYVRGTEALWRHAGRGKAVRPWQVTSLVAATLALVMALLSPLDALAGTLLWAHMIQHLLLLSVAPPLLVLAAPLLPLTWALPRSTRRNLRRLTPPLAVRRNLSAPVVVAMVVALHIVIVLAWHAPAFYQAALRNDLAHHLEHASMLGSAWLLWWLLLRGGEAGKARYGLAVAAVFMVGVTGGALGALLTFSQTSWYPAYDTAGAAAWGLTPLEDQQLAGLVMWIPGGAIHMATGAVLFAAWLRALERRLDRPSGPLPRVGSMAGWMLLGVLTLVVVGCTAQPRYTTPALTGSVDRGRQLVADYGCVACHAIPGIAIHPSQAGPPLDGYANRQTIAGLLPNTPANLAAWVEDPQEIDPGNLMPNVGVTEAEAADIAAYLLSLD